MKIKVVSDGTRRGTKVIDADSGQIITNVMKCTVSFDYNDYAAAGVPVAQIVPYGPDVELCVDAAVTHQVDR